MLHHFFTCLPFPLFPYTERKMWGETRSKQNNIFYRSEFRKSYLDEIIATAINNEKY